RDLDAREGAGIDAADGERDLAGVPALLVVEDVLGRAGPGGVGSLQRRPRRYRSPARVSLSLSRNHHRHPSLLHRPRASPSPPAGRCPPPPAAPAQNPAAGTSLRNPAVVFSPESRRRWLFSQRAAPPPPSPSPQTERRPSSVPSDRALPSSFPSVARRPPLPFLRCKGNQTGGCSDCSHPPRLDPACCSPAAMQPATCSKSKHALCDPAHGAVAGSHERRCWKFWVVSPISLRFPVVPLTVPEADESDAGDILRLIPPHVVCLYVVDAVSASIQQGVACVHGKP
ncbi:hypothetical protein BRADI_4g29747v3, partial [Brachypodium distachyon]